METDEVNGYEGRLFWMIEPGGDGEAECGHGGIGEGQEEELLVEVAGHVAEVVDEKAHPEGLSEEEGEEEEDLGEEEGGGV